MTAILSFHSYRYYPYEKVLARREAAQLLKAKTLHEHEDRIEVPDVALSQHAKRLTYFARANHGRLAFETFQGQLERVATTGKNRQATRYSVHGLHEYKGKFNPQIVKAILNIFDIRAGANVLDPFCGSGTTLVECAHMGAHCVGFDLNPFAVYIANAKLQALSTPAEYLARIVSRLKTTFSRLKRWRANRTHTDRIEYLQAWFNPEILDAVEIVRTTIEECAAEHAPILLAVASNLLREYSLQDPNDLRIRRRKTPLPTMVFSEAVIEAAAAFILRLQDTQSILGIKPHKAKAVLYDTTGLLKKPKTLFDSAITSPPYAMALPYIDTQRLSLVWLGLISPSEILPLDAELVGSREVRGVSRASLNDCLAANHAEIPEAQRRFCTLLFSSLAPTDGFRRQAVPGLLYRYFGAMQDSFVNVHQHLKLGAPYALVVGHNHSTLGGKRIEIDTPMHLAALAKHVGWAVDEMIPLQTYRRYGYHMNNAVADETLLLLRRQ